MMGSVKEDPYQRESDVQRAQVGGMCRRQKQLAMQPSRRKRREMGLCVKKEKNAAKTE